MTIQLPVLFFTVAVMTMRNAKRANIAEWVKTHFAMITSGMIVLDADSLMGRRVSWCPLTRAWVRMPAFGLIQNLPTIIRADTLYSRIQQFANHCFGPIYASGLAAWHRWFIRIWGHKTPSSETQGICRRLWFTCIGRAKPFGGHALSHDFREAALLRRAGWGVRFDTDLTASYEEAPPSLVDVIVRGPSLVSGKPTAQAFCVSERLSFATRLASFYSGIMSYLSAFFLAVVIVVGFALAITGRLVLLSIFANPSCFNIGLCLILRKRGFFILSMRWCWHLKCMVGLAAMHWIFRRCLQCGGPILMGDLEYSGRKHCYQLCTHPFDARTVSSGLFVVFTRQRTSGWNLNLVDDGATSWGVACACAF